MLKRFNSTFFAVGRAYVAWTVAAVVLGAGLYQQLGGEMGEFMLINNPESVMARPWTLLTSAFVSTGPMQMWANVVLCAALGSIYEATNRPLRTFTVFFAAIISASLAFIAGGCFTAQDSANYVTLTGCSAGILAFAGALLARGRHYTWIIILASLELSGIAAANPAGALAHVIGLGVGVASCFIYESHKTENPNTCASVVDKARCSGYASLTPAERELLFYNSSDTTRATISKSNTK